MDCKGIVAADFFIKTSDKKSENVTVFKDRAPSCDSSFKKNKGSSSEQVVKRTTNDIFVTKDADENFLRILKAIKRGKGQGVIYMYAASTAFEGQDQSDEKVDGENHLDTTTPLYVFGRIQVFKGDESSDALFVMLSYCKGVDTDNESGYAWKDLYKAIRKPQFQFSSIVLDMNGNVVCRSHQQNMLRPDLIVHDVAPVVDMLLLTAVSYPLIPNGSQFTNAVVSVVEEIESWF
jgi:hypothetical protein